MKKLFIITTSILAIITTSIAILVYATDLGNRGYKITNNGLGIGAILDSTGHPPSHGILGQWIQEHGQVKGISNRTCHHPIFVPTKTSTEFSRRYNATHDCYSIIDMPTPQCGTISNTCTEGTVSNTGTLYGDCGKDGCLPSRIKLTDTWDCSNAQSTIGCTFVHPECIADSSCSSHP